MMFISLIVLAIFSISVVTGHYFILFPLYILAIIATSNKTKTTFITIFYLCLLSILVSIYLAQSQRASLDSSNLITPIIALLTTVAAYLILRSRNAHKSADVPINNPRLGERQEIKILQQLSGTVAHDFNNVMCVVMANAEMLQNNLPQSSNSPLFIDAILGAVQKGTNLTHSLLSFAQKQFLQTANIDLNQLIIEHISNLNFATNDRSKIHFAASTGLWTARIAPTYFEECLIHLIQNAIQANSTHINLKISNIVDNSSFDKTLRDCDHYLLIEISDDGVGISEENLLLIYQPFFTTKKDTGAKGLGLSVVYGFCQQSGGRIYVVSKLEKGATFKMIVPAIMPEK
jgi:signal transduction histidine kinase